FDDRLLDIVSDRLADWGIDRDWLGVSAPQKSGSPSSQQSEVDIVSSETVLAQPDESPKWTGLVGAIAEGTKAAGRWAYELIA
ncbi:hypothetical protein, partial [Leifsonia sp. SIMBA_070]|uniref:hypothetical protein n=1 Tax=Leifsonia sp. SIMBA_070 TaxID=3085810 RepID=UPI00397D7748